MCFTFLKAQGNPVGDSLCEDDMVDTCKRLLDSGAAIRLPSDVTALGPGGEIGNPDAGGDVRQLNTSIPDGWKGLDIGPGSSAEFSDAILDARTAFWNGPRSDESRAGKECFSTCSTWWSTSTKKKKQ